jgi:hypothetical protein
MATAVRRAGQSWFCASRASKGRSWRRRRPSASSLEFRRGLAKIRYRQGLASPRAAWLRDHDLEPGQVVDQVVDGAFEVEAGDRVATGERFLGHAGGLAQLLHLVAVGQRIVLIGSGSSRFRIR